MSHRIKIVCGFRRDQEHSIDADEAHKAYYIFLHPEARTVFKNGLAVKGDQIQEIVPDWHGTMGWNPTHNLTSDDWNEIRDKRMHVSMQRIMKAATEIAQLCAPEDLNTPLHELVEKKYPQLMPPTVERREGKMTALKDILKN